MGTKGLRLVVWATPASGEQKWKSSRRGQAIGPRAGIVVPWQERGAWHERGQAATTFRHGMRGAADVWSMLNCIPDAVGVQFIDLCVSDGL